MSTMYQIKKAVALVALPAGLLLAGCPDYPGGGGGNPQAQYDAGFVVGFAQDSEYWQGFDDSYDTVDGGDIYYTGHEIPQLNEISYDAGYYDGLWYAYNDGYFVAYDYAFTIGFSEGYDVAYGPGWRNFLLNDEHVEWLDGGFSDGYNDGFSEGRILGASDYIDGLTFDWLDALLWYQDVDENGYPNDIYFEDLDLGTGEYGPVYLYEYGTNPFDLVKSARKARNDGKGIPRIRGKSSAKQSELPELSYRPLPSDVQQQFNVAPTTTGRSEETLDLESTWLERINAYNAAYGKAAATKRAPLK